MFLTTAQIVITFNENGNSMRSILNYESVIAAQNDFCLFTKFGNNQEGKFQWQLMLMKDEIGNFKEEQKKYTDE